MHPLFQNDLLYACVTGTQVRFDKRGLKNFMCSKIKLTCKELNQKVDQCTREIFLNIMHAYSGLENVSNHFIYKWVMGKPVHAKLCKVQENYTLDNFSLEMMLEKTKTPTIPLPETFKNSIFNWQHAFHEQSNCRIFLFQESLDEFRLEAISFDTLNSITNLPLQDKLTMLSGRLIAFEKRVLLCSTNQGPLQIHKIDISEGHIYMTPLDVTGGPVQWPIKSIISIMCHLDKLFIIGLLNQGQSWIKTFPHLMTIDMTNQAIEATINLGTSNNFPLSLFSSDLGKIHVMLQRHNTLDIFNIDYT